MRTVSTRIRPLDVYRGLALVELMVVIGVLSMLAALLLPALHTTREAARRVSCANNLHQIGIGLLGYHDAHGAFPVGCTEHRSYVRGGRQLAWSARLLPFLEQAALYQRLNLDVAFDSPKNAEAAAVVIPVYLCPSNPHPSLWIDSRAVCDYGGIYGERLLTSHRLPNGTMLYDRQISVSDITDGTSFTLIVSEDSNSADMQWINGLNVFEQMYPINRAPRGENEICSQHIGDGAHGLFCDGSVRFLRETMARDVLAAICTRAAGEWVDDLE